MKQKRKGRFEADGARSGCRQMRDHIYNNVPQREKPEQRIRIGALRLGMSV